MLIREPPLQDAQAFPAALAIECVRILFSRSVSLSRNPARNQGPNTPSALVAIGLQSRQYK